jgi:hypothetical protein
MVGFPQMPQQGWHHARSAYPEPAKVKAAQMLRRCHAPWPVGFASIRVEEKVESVPCSKYSEQTIAVMVVEVRDE